METVKSLDNLNKIDHIVVLMLENRSFDHILGYLKLEGGRADVDGLANTMSNIAMDGTVYPVHHLDSIVFELDPSHEGDDVDEQISNNNGGFVANFERMCHPTNPGAVMGYYNASDVLTYDHLVREFMVCDRWFSSVPGATWPNRLYALTGYAAGSRNYDNLPVYNNASFLRHLDAQGIPWRWYYHDFATLRLADGKYRIGHDDKFFLFDSKSFFESENFLDHAARGDLASVSWIDPNFVNFGSANANDDHPPTDIRAGQALVQKVYDALLTSPIWEKTLLVITYDEHGGFYDHVTPPEAADDDPNFRRYGCRVPALIVSPWVEQGGVSHTVFDHTSIIKTILLRFCRQADGSIPAMGERVANANHLGGVLTEVSPRTAPQPPERHKLLDLAARYAQAAKHIEQTPQTAQEPCKLQQGFLAAKRMLAAYGLLRE